MSQLSSNSTFRYLLVGLGFAVFLAVATAIYFRLTSAYQTDRVYAVARQLGHTEQTHLVQTEWCWDLSSHCGIFVHYIIDVDFVAFQKQISHLGMVEKLSRSADGNTIFTEINMQSHRRLTANANDGMLNSPAFTKPEAYRWWLVDQQSRNFFISFYSTADTGDTYAIDGELLHGNIITVMLQTK